MCKVGKLKEKYLFFKINPPIFNCFKRSFSYNMTYFLHILLSKLNLSSFLKFILFSIFFELQKAFEVSTFFMNTFV